MRIAGLVAAACLTAGIVAGSAPRQFELESQSTPPAQVRTFRGDFVIAD
jgi:hypothetical protein